MLPIYLLCHADCKNSTYLCNYLDKRNIIYTTINAISEDIKQIDLNSTSGLIIMGGKYSVNDGFSWITDEIRLIQSAIQKDMPIMGVCFGAQLISKALGADVSTATNMEAGWHQIKADTSQFADSHDIKLENSFEVFEWHEDTFSVPDGAVPIFSGRNIKNQGYLYNKIIAMQFHLEMNEHMIHQWLKRYRDCMPKTKQYVQSPEQITERLGERLDNLHAVADNIYGLWLSRF